MLKCRAPEVFGAFPNALLRRSPQSWLCSLGALNTHGGYAWWVETIMVVGYGISNTARMVVHKSSISPFISQGTLYTSITTSPI